MQTKIAIGCIIQWYEVELYEEYIDSLINAIEFVDDKSKVLVDICFYLSENLEKIDSSKKTISEIREKFYETEKKLLDLNINCIVNYYDATSVFSISDYRREFNDEYCGEADVLMWGETDSLIPRQTFRILDALHINNKNAGVFKYLAFFGTNKMWDDSWKQIEHNDFTDKPFIHEDNDNWWSINYVTTIEEMNKINDSVEELDVRVVSPYKFNGCGLVISSDVIKSGVNIPKAILLVHEDTAFQNALIRFFKNEVPQFVIKNIFLPHNRKNPKKRMYVKGEDDIDDLLEKRKSNHWYKKVWELDHIQAHDMYSQNKIYKWEEIINE